MKKKVTKFFSGEIIVTFFLNVQFCYLPHFVIILDNYIKSLTSSGIYVNILIAPIRRF